MTMHFDKLDRNELIALHPGLSALMRDRREQYKWLEAKLTPARIISVTELLRCARYRWNVNRNPSMAEVVDDAARWRMARGTLLHAGLDALSGHPGSERMLWQALSPQVVVAGTPDLVIPMGNSTTIFDLKTTRTLPNGEPYESHVMQLRLYSWLVAAGGCQTPFEGVVAYMSAADGFRGYRFELVPYSTEEVRELVALAEREAPPPAEPVAAYECGRCPFTECPKHGDKAEAKPKPEWQTEADPFGLLTPELDA